MHPLNNLHVLQYLGNELDMNEKKSTCFQQWIEEGFRALEKTLKIFYIKGQFCFGESPGLFDVCITPQVYNGLRFNYDLSGYPRIQSIWDQCMTLDAFKNAAPEAQPDSSTKKTC